jgi:imidazolonepropionase-like amidohydrolase
MLRETKSYFFCVHRAFLTVVGLCVLTMGAGLGPQANVWAQDPALAIRCGQLIDVNSGSTVTGATILVRGHRIEAVGLNLVVPHGSKVLDLSRATCLPGLMDLHAHFMFDPSRSTDENYFLGSSAYKALHGLKRVQEFLQLGFTTLRDPSDFDKYFAMVEVRDAIARGDFVGPRIFAAPHALTATGGHGDFNDLAPDVVEMAFGKVISGPNSAREAVREEIKYGADWIKLFVSGGIMSAHDDPRVQQLTDEEVQAAVDEAHRFKKKVAVHAIGSEAIKESIRAGVDSVEHGDLIDDEGIRLMKERGTYLDPTLYVLNYIVEEGPKIGIPENSIAKGRAILEERDRCIRKAFAARVKVVFGSDAIYPISYVPREFQLMVKLGLTPMEAIQAATINSATLLGIQDMVGSLEAGKHADIIATEQNPVDDVGALAHVKFVMKGGQVVKNEF